jgi:hypothetical protein
MIYVSCLLRYIVLEIIGALCPNVIACFGKPHACSVLQEYFHVL